MSETPEQRSRTMRAVKSKDTAPEMIVRKICHARGYRYRLHRDDMPGKPDLVFPSRKKIIFVHGCFWHGHTCKRGNRTPEKNREYWTKKITSNMERDKKHMDELESLGWSILVIWECETRKRDILEDSISKFLGFSR
uniref:Very short patch repair endonuclease n=1 Tax=Candidatus Kentrum sp. LPFa TaxID=2126335 RepID=A0A450X0V1_9GAMM|nr:MAG: T/G mismatch-specific endonuclease [Candidatus Kentron sp. LPFa]VFK22934.1 MAG: T/G mismatch-specific endonuclease [Candidatus Kentron sp. LPFa]